MNVLETGKNGGGYRFSSQERLQFVNPNGTLSNVKVCVISYEYAAMVVKGGVATIERKA
jgi:hypothetical protein